MRLCAGARRKRRRIGERFALLSTLVVTAGFVLACAHAPRVAPLTPEERELELRSFDQVWTTIRDKHYDPGLGGLDWNAIRDLLRPRVERAVTRAESRAAMTSLIDTLGLSHFGIIPADVYEEMAGHSGGEGTCGLDFRLVDGRAVVVEVEPGSPAESLGVKPGWVLVRAGRREIEPALARLQAQFEQETTRELVMTMALRSWIGGAVGGEIETRFLDGDDREVRRTLPLVMPRGNRSQFGNLPPIHAWIESRRLEGEIGYIRFPIFLDPGTVMTGFNEAMESFVDTKGVIIDLRGNPGGIGAMAMGMASWLVEGDGRRLGVMKTRDNEIKFTVNPRARTYGGAAAVLIDGLSASTSEILAAGLRDLGRARLFGATTAGAALPSAIEKLPNGDGFQYAFADYLSDGGARLEGVGVTPDVPVEMRRDVLLSGRDAVLDAAVIWMREGH